MSGLKLRLVPCPEDRNQSTSQKQNDIETQSKKVMYSFTQIILLQSH